MTVRSANKPINIHILEKEYLIACPEEEREALIKAARYLDQAMREVRDSRKVIGTERIAVITALNITNELLLKNQERDVLSESVSTSIARVLDKIDVALQGDKSDQRA